MRVLFVSSEVHPLIKTGGLADVAGALPKALRDQKQDVTIMLPAYPMVKHRAKEMGEPVSIGDPLSVGETFLIPALQPQTRMPMLLVDCPSMFAREGNPYVDGLGHDWPDNHLRFALLSRAAATVAMGDAAGIDRFDLVHCNDWQSGLIPAYLAYDDEVRIKTVLTIHNIQFQGLFDGDLTERVGLPEESYTIDGVEFWDKLSYLKAGVVYADAITTVSPTYAEEIKTEDGGFGMDGLLRERAEDLTGILNGADYDAWDPAIDPALSAPFDATDPSNKARNKTDLQNEMDLTPDPEAPLIGMVSRLTEQKGVDLLLEALPRILDQGAQLVVLGAGDHAFEAALRDAALHHPGRVAALIGYDEAVSHRIQGGADLFAMPSRREPCGLTQLYALRYGTLPIVRRTGGLADTVVDLSDGKNGTGFVFDDPTPEEFADTVERACALYRSKDAWRQAVQRAMTQDFGWQRSAKDYIALYEGLVKRKR